MHSNARQRRVVWNLARQELATIGERKPAATIRPVSRRKALKIAAGSAAAAVAGLAAPGVIAAGKDKILIGVPSLSLLPMAWPTTLII